MPNPNTKGISVHVDRELHAEITAYLQEHNMKMGDFITLAAQDLLRPPSPEIDPHLQAEIKAYLDEHDMTMDEFFSRAAQNELHPHVPGIDARLQTEINSYLDEHDMTMDKFIALAAQDELRPKTPKVEGKSMKENTRTLAFQVPESLYQRVNAYKERHHMTLRSFVLGLIEEELDNDEELLRKQQEGATPDEDEDLSESSKAPVSLDNPGNEYEDEQEEEPDLGDSEGAFDEPNEEDQGQEIAEAPPDYGLLGAAMEVSPNPDFGDDIQPPFPEPDEDEEQEYGGMGMAM